MTDYTSLNAVKAALGSSETADDDLLAVLITQASRAVDRLCAGFVGSDDYFTHDETTDEILTGIVLANKLFCWPRKPKVESVSALAYRFDAREDWLSLAAAYTELSGYTVSIWGVPGQNRRAQVKISYTGGFDPLPDDLVNAVTLLAVRFYKEIKSGLTDSIGIAELGTLQYTKALPARVVEMLRPYKRMVPV